MHHIFFSEADTFQNPYYDALDILSHDAPRHFVSTRQRLHALFVMMPHSAIHTHPADDGILHYDRIAFHRTNDDVYVHYAPRPSTPPQFEKRFAVAHGHSVRVRYNARYAVDASWVYDKWVFNIGTVSTVATDMFLDNELAHTYSFLVDLW